MIGAITQILVFQLIGEFIVRTLLLRIPGRVIGMARRFAALVARGGPSKELRSAAQGQAPLRSEELAVAQALV
ncbi:MAG: putative effector of murein hydrolase LrgA [Candidatus Accumulibacter appositus]|uniref:Putative effector of murein hydrolase LrgA n=1 Tax=Candidatus Accumulibacter appositus TaxID=1454003 RepID=A0A011NI98_9PROT|nr:hypothetical protein [Accumulibacter sp.]EXI82483.1 MAG: putative effector of murein hydrolase LrgA [Candidatus Accumulibacter appositus]